MKYVRLRNLSTGDEIVLMALAPVGHDDLVTAFSSRGYEAISAGFLRIDPLAIHGVQTLGHSTSLGLRPQADDAALISMLYGATLQLVRPHPKPAL